MASRGPITARRDALEQVAVLALSSDGDPEHWDYIIAAAPIGPRVWTWGYWHIPDPQPGDTYVLLRAHCEADDAADLIVQGTREQYFADGYEAADVITDAAIIDHWTVEE